MVRLVVQFSDKSCDYSRYVTTDCMTLRLMLQPVLIKISLLFILGNIRSHFIFAHFALVLVGKFKDWANSNLINLFNVFKQCLGEIKMGQN